MKHLELVVATAALGAILGSPPQSLAKTAFDACVEKLCVSTAQMNCWVKSGTELCSDGGGCIELPDHAGARVLKRTRTKWKVETQYGTGWVSDRYMLVDSSYCPGL